ncbi:MAG: cysteine hydrolase [Oscillospiraceae bacterium]|nr:cysteine hydrolase [Oscillospiraceae bacterium]
MDRKSALIVIDMQQGFLSPASAQCITGAAATVPACTALINNCRERNIPVFFVVRKYRADGSDVEHTRYNSWLKGGKALSPGCDSSVGDAMPEAFGFCQKDYLIVKPRFSAFFQTELDIMLRRLGINTVLLAGTTTPNCIRSTCYDAISLEYNAVVFSDCTSSVTEEIQQANLLDMGNVGAQIISSEDFISGKVKITDSTGDVQRRVRP